MLFFFNAVKTSGFSLYSYPHFYYYHDRGLHPKPATASRTVERRDRSLDPTRSHILPRKCGSVFMLYSHTHTWMC